MLVSLQAFCSMNVDDKEQNKETLSRFLIAYIHKIPISIMFTSYSCVIN